MSASLLEHFAVLEDPRMEPNKRHALLDILVLVVSAVYSHAQGLGGDRGLWSSWIGSASLFRWRMAYPHTTALNT